MKKNILEVGQLQDASNQDLTEAFSQIKKVMTSLINSANLEGQLVGTYLVESPTSIEQYSFDVLTAYSQQNSQVIFEIVKKII